VVVEEEEENDIDFFTPKISKLRISQGQTKSLVRKPPPRRILPEEDDEEENEEEEDGAKICKVCHKAFTMTASHILWFEKRGIPVPRTCELCRKMNKEE